MLNYIRNIYFGLQMRALTRRIMQNDPQQGWNRADKREWA